MWRRRSQQATKIKIYIAAHHNRPEDSIHAVRFAWLSSLPEKANEKVSFKPPLSISVVICYREVIKIVPTTETHL